MSMDQNFRSALNGFNRADVVSYMEENAIAQEKALRQLRDENAKLHENLEKLRTEKEGLAAALSDAAAPEMVEIPAEPLNLPPCVPGELELTAYRRAEAMERNARLRARKLCRQVNDIIEEAAAKMTGSGDEVETLMHDLSINLRRLTDTFAALKLTFDDTATAFERITPLDVSEYEG